MFFNGFMFENGMLVVLFNENFGAAFSKGLLKEARSTEHSGAPLDNQECRSYWYMPKLVFLFFYLALNPSPTCGCSGIYQIWVLLLLV